MEQPAAVPPSMSADPVAPAASTSSTNPLYVAGGIAIGVLGLALAAVAIRREFSR